MASMPMKAGCHSTHNASAGDAETGGSLELADQLSELLFYCHLLVPSQKALSLPLLQLVSFPRMKIKVSFLPLNLRFLQRPGSKLVFSRKVSWTPWLCLDL